MPGEVRFQPLILRKILQALEARHIYLRPLPQNVLTILWEAHPEWVSQQQIKALQKNVQGDARPYRLISDLRGAFNKCKPGAGDEIIVTEPGQYRLSRKRLQKFVTDITDGRLADDVIEWTLFSTGRCSNATQSVRPLLLIEGDDTVGYANETCELICEYLTARGYLSLHIPSADVQRAADLVDRIKRLVDVESASRLDVVLRKQGTYPPGIAAYCSCVDPADPTAYIKPARKQSRIGRPPKSRLTTWIEGPSGTSYLIARAQLRTWADYDFGVIRIAADIDQNEAQNVWRVLHRLNDPLESKPEQLSLPFDEHPGRKPPDMDTSTVTPKGRRPQAG